MKALVAALFMGASFPAVQAEVTQAVPLAQASMVQLERASVAALAAGRPAAAFAMAQELLARDPKNALGHYLVARIMVAAGNTVAARKEARLSFGMAQSRRQHYETARLAGQIALADRRWSAAQYWARQTIQYAPDARARAVGVSDFRRLRAASPYSFSLKVGVRPTNNANGGADERDYVVNGVDTGAFMSGAALALRGVVGSAAADVSWRVAQSERAQTTLGLSGFVRAIEFAGTPRDLWGNEIRNSEYSAAALGASLRHARGFGEGRSAVVAFDLGRMWQGGRPAYDWAGLRVDGAQQLSPTLLASLGAGLERREWVASARHDLRSSLSFGTTQRGAKGETRFNVLANVTDSASTQVRSWSVTASASYAPQASVGPLEMKLSAGLSKTVYPDYIALGLQGGRRDTMAYAELGLWAPKLGVAAFAPEVTVRAARVNSNVSRFSYSELAVALGWRSAF